MTIPAFPTLDAPVRYWAEQRPQACALACADQQLSFLELAQAMDASAGQLRQARAPAVVWAEGATPLSQLVHFLGIIASGRCAAIADPAWPGIVRSQVEALVPQTSADLTAPSPETPFYIGFTSGSTGLPKGFRRHHASWIASLQAGLDAFGPATLGRVLSPGSLSHSLFLFGALQGLWNGAGAILQARFSAGQALDLLAAGAAECLVAVPSQLLLMLGQARRRQRMPLEQLRQVQISGARWMRERTPELRAVFPQAQIIEFYGASETSYIAWMEADEHAPWDVVGRPFPSVELDVRGAPAPGEPGLLYVRSPMLFIDYAGSADDASAALRDGDWLSVRDVGWLDADGWLHLAGRQMRMIVTKGKNLFPDEIEQRLQAHPDILAASVQAVPDALRGAVPVALLQLAPGARPSAASLAAWCQATLEQYKLPRRYLAVAAWPQTASGKHDHKALARMLADEGGTTCLTPIP